MTKNKSKIEKLALRRAKRSISCLPFKRAFYEEIDKNSLSAEELCRRKDWDQIVFAPFGEERAEEHFKWMIRVGILRREVDGQGLTSRIRLTPMGRKILSMLDGEVKRAGLREMMLEILRRHLILL